MKSEAFLSQDRKFRYWLVRVWDEALPLLCVIGCNPSTAAEKDDDPTIRKEIGFSKRLGFGGILKLNVGAYRATDPKVWKLAADPFGPENTIDHLQDLIQNYAPGATVAAWGKCCTDSIRGSHRAREIQKRIIGLQCWGRNKDGSPRHPLMLPYSTVLEPFSY